MTAKIEGITHGKLFLPALGLAVFSAWLVTVTFELNLIDIAHSFHVQVGTVSFTAAVGSISGIAVGFLLSVLSVRVNHKLLLLTGLGCSCLAAIGFFLAPTFALLLVPNIAVGAGIAMGTAMAYALIGDFYPFEKRGKAIGWIVAATALTNIIGPQIVGVITSISRWRAMLIWFSLPVTLVSILLALMVIPNKTNQDLIPPK